MCRSAQPQVVRPRRRGHLRSLAFLVALVALFASTGGVRHTEAVIERIYTLPFWDSYTLGYRFGEYPGHQGTDYFIGAYGTGGEPVVAASGGTAYRFEQLGTGAGKYVAIDHPNGHKTRYLHLSSWAVSNGEVVGRGTLIGYEGNTGVADGSYHLHFETRHNATAGDCCSGTAVDPYASSTYMWIADPPGYYAPTYYNFQSWLLHTGTPLAQTNAGQWTYAVADWNRDGTPDLIGIKMNNTASGMTEVHILSGTSRFQQWALHVATPLQATDAANWAFAMGDWNRDGTPDLIVVKKQGASSTEVHILSGASNFQVWLLHAVTPLEKTSYNWRFEVGDYNRDGTPDLYGIKMYLTGTNSLEVHVLSGASNFGSWLLHTGTPLAETIVGYWSFAVSDWSLDVNRKPDLWVVKQSGATSTEVHILAGELAFQSWLLHTGTPLARTDTAWQFDAADYDRNQVPDLNIIKLNGPTSTEVHVLGG